MSALLLLVLCLTGCAAALLAGPGHRVRRLLPAAARPGAVAALRSRAGRDVAAEAAEWIAMLRRLSGLLEAGRSPAAAFAGVGGPDRGATSTPTARHIQHLCVSVAAATRLGLSASDALGSVPAARTGHRGLDRRAASSTAELALCWEVSERTGAPLTGLLGGLADALEADLDAEAARSTAMAGPRSTVRILTGLPVLGIGLGMLMGVDPLGILFTTPWGLAALTAGAALTAVGRTWTRLLIARAEAVGAR